MDKVLKQTATFAHVQPQREDKEKVSNIHLLPVGLRKGELTTRLQQVLVHHGAVLQLPHKPVFIEAKVHQNSISLSWELPGQAEVTTDRTRVYSLQCFADVPFKYKPERLLHLKKRFLSVPSTGASPESGFDEPSEVSSQHSEAKSTLPSIPPSLICSQNISLVTMNSGAPVKGAKDEKQLDQDTVKSEENDERGKSECEEGGVYGPKPGQKASRVMKPLFPEPVHMPYVIDGAANKKQTPQLHRDPSTQASAALLSLPPLLTKTVEEGKTKLYHNDGRGSPSPACSNPDLRSDSNMSGIFGDVEDTPRNAPPTKSRDSQPPKTILEQEQMVLTDSTSMASDSSSISTEDFTSMGRFCEGYAFEEIYNGLYCQFRYSGVVPGVTYYFRVLCHNAAGDGPWSDTIKCSVPAGIAQ